MSRMDLDILINPIIGGIIGYATNYLAIKMLFRPHEAKYIGKIKIPFTPGLIPKEKATLAKQMGEITESYLLTEDMLVETLTGPKVKDVFVAFTEGIPVSIKDSKKTIGQVAQDILGDQLQSSTEAVVDQLALEIITILRSQDVMAQVIPYISNAVWVIAKDHISKGMSDNAIAHYIKGLALNSLENGTTKEHIYKTIDELEETLYLMLRENAARIGEGIIGAVGEGEEAEKIKETLQHWIDENFNPMVSMFVKVDKIYEGIINFATEALHDPERNKKFGELLCTVVKGIKESDPDYKDTVIDMMKNQINEENMGILISIIVNELSNKEIPAKVQIEKWVYNKWEQSVDTEEFSRLIKKVLRELAGYSGKIPFADVSLMIPNNAKKQINDKVFSYYIKLVKNNSTSVAQIMNISHIVESKINEFSSKEAEKLILSVVKTQLRGITWIGALLGTLIGIVSNFIG